MKLTRWDALIVILVITLLIVHHAVPERLLWAHLPLFWLFQVPVLMGAITRGRVGGLVAAGFVSVAVTPHAVGLTRYHGLLANNVWLDLVTLCAIGFGIGWLRDRLRRAEATALGTNHLENLGRIIEALRVDLTGPARAMRGLLTSMEPLRDRQPAVGFALHQLEQTVAPVAQLADRFALLRLHPKVAVVGVDRILDVTAARLRHLGVPARAVTLEWQCPPAAIQASVRSLSSALAALVLHLGPASDPIRISVSSAPGRLLLDLRSGADKEAVGGASWPPPSASFEMACQVIRAHRGTVEPATGEGRMSGWRIQLPTVTSVRARGGRPAIRRMGVENPRSARSRGGFSRAGRNDGEEPPADQLVENACYATGGVRAITTGARWHAKCFIRASMKRIHRLEFLSTALALVLSAGSVAAAPPASVEIDSLVALALRGNARLEALRQSHRAATERIPRAGALPDPLFSITANEVPLGTANPGEAMEKRFGLTQMVPFPGKLGLMESMSDVEARMAADELARARLEVAAETRRAVLDLALLYASVEVIDETQTTVRQLSAVARTKYEVGRAMQQDLLKANVELAMEETKLVVLRERIPAAEARINALLNRQQDEAVGRPRLRGEVGELPELAQLEARAFEIQPMLRMRDRAVARDEFALKLARKEGLPDFMLGGEYMALRDNDDAWMGMVGMTLPIWRGSKVGPARREAEGSLAASRAQLTETRNTVGFMVREAWTMVATSRATVNLFTHSVLPQAEQSLASARAAYETDRAGFLDLLDSVRTLLQFRLEYEESLAEYLKSLADLGLAVGDLRMLGGTDEQ